MSDEPEIIINGIRLTDAQAMAVRVAVSSFDVDCGDDEHGRAMNKAYTARLNEVFRLMIGKAPVPNGERDNVR